MCFLRHRSAPIAAASTSAPTPTPTPTPIFAPVDKPLPPLSDAKTEFAGTTDELAASREEDAAENAEDDIADSDDWRRSEAFPVGSTIDDELLEAGMAVLVETAEDEGGSVVCEDSKAVLCAAATEDALATDSEDVLAAAALEADARLD